MASVRYSFVTKALIKILQFLCRFKGNNTFVPYDQEDWDANGAHQLAIRRVRRCKNIKSTYLGPQPRIGYEFDEFGRTMRVSKPCLSQHVTQV